MLGIAQAQDPQIPTLTHVSVDSISNEVYIHWTCVDPNVEGYYIYKKDVAGLWVILDTVPDAFTYLYVTTDSNSDEEIEYYSVASYDLLGNYSQRSLPHNTLLINADLPNCSRENMLSWNPYLNMQGFQGYKLTIIGKETLTKNEVLDTIVYLNENSLSYLHDNLDYSTKYRYIIAAFNDEDTVAKGSRVSASTTELNQPTFTYLNRVTVNEDNDIEIYAVCDEQASVRNMRFYRTFIENGQPLYIGEAVVGQDNSSFFIDESTFPENTIYYYSVKVVDVCDNEYELNDYHQSNPSVSYNLQLNSSFVTEDEIAVFWNDYDAFLSNTNYNLWLDVNNQANWLKQVDSFSEDLIDISSLFGRVCVYLQAEELNVNALGRLDSVKSNRVCVNKPPLIFLPTAFSPNSDYSNDEWKPEIYGREAIQSFDLKIFNAWGEKVIESASLEFVWNGKIKGTEAPVGVYTFNLQYSFGNGVKDQKVGVINLVR